MWDNAACACALLREYVLCCVVDVRVCGEMEE